MLFSKFVFDLVDKVTYNSCNRNNIPDIIIERDVIYNYEYQDICTQDLYYKRTEVEKKYPILLNIHGGGFVAGDKMYRLKFSKRWLNRVFLLYQLITVFVQNISSHSLFCNAYQL